MCALQGMRRNPSTGIKTKVYGNEEADVPIQMALWTSPAADARFQEVRVRPRTTYFLPPNHSTLSLQRVVSCALTRF